MNKVKSSEQETVDAAFAALEEIHRILLDIEGCHNAASFVVLAMHSLSEWDDGGE